MIYLQWSAMAAVWLALAVLLLFGAKKLFDLLTPYSVDVQLTEKDNPAVGLILAGFLMGVAAILCGTFAGDGGDEVVWSGLAIQVCWVALYVFIGTILLFFAGILSDKCVLSSFKNQEEVIDHQNMGVASVIAASYLGAGLIIAAGISGSFSFFSAIIPFFAGQVAFILFARLYQGLTKHDDLEEIGEKKNVAAGVAYAGTLLAYALILMKGVSMSGEGIEAPLDCVWHFLYYAFVGAVLLVIARFVADRVFLPKARLHDEIVSDRNLSAGFIEAGMALAASSVLIFCL